MEMGRTFGMEEAGLIAGIKAMTTGMAGTFFDSGLESKEVVDLVPVRPLGEEEAAIGEMYRNRLGGLYQKLKSN
ncbi:hypothetical protein EDC14_103840 [Hydrogenispora ethanolica]|jgi:hypothetical protein|uniref:Uncharacterized protein n=1 Tax=Hydrogenispora ethanolica TaxID=1082276 RepID=A0A4V2QCC6_HYDET|nr:hypothetical protein [Hydrogenispora ethanolica]TCL59747.1 hypothetical protein EDC14_103840 [Hydrogenispora ethanolica]